MQAFFIIIIRAPIIFRHCANCHSPGQSAPFSLLSYTDVRKRARLIAEVVGKHLMPPWLPGPDDGPFFDECRLSETQIGRVTQWVAEGVTEGAPKDLPPQPDPVSEWQLGRPDLIVQMPAPYHLAPDGKDVYRNFVFPIPVERRRFVKAVELHPGNSQVVHHAFMQVDDAVQNNRQLLAHDPTDPIVRAKLGTALLAIGETSEALKHLQTAVKLKLDYAETHYQLGSIYLRQGRLSEAGVEFQTVLRLNPRDFEALGSLGLVYLGQRNMAQAQRCFEQVLNLYPDDATARNNLERIKSQKTGLGGYSE